MIYKNGLKTRKEPDSKDKQKGLNIKIQSDKR